MSQEPTKSEIYRHHDLEAPQIAPAPVLRQFANPAPLGLCAFALSTFVLSLINCNAASVTKPNVVVGLAFFYGGFSQLLAGMWEVVVGNTFGATALTSYGAFWMAWGALNVPAFGIQAAYNLGTAEGKAEFEQALGFFLLGWFIFTFILLLCTLKSSVIFFSIFFFLTITFLILSISHLLGGVPTITRVGGGFGLITAFLAWYAALAGIASEKNTFIKVPMFPFSWNPVDGKIARD